jgi:uncharacterized protein YndB with AHSA1/START domain
MAENDLGKRTLTLKKTFDAPIELVWEAWTDPKHIAGWWGPKGMAVRIVQHNFKVGGNWKYVMAMPDGSEFIGEGVYSEIVKLEKIVTSAIERKGKKTNFTFSVIHPTEEYCKQQEKMGFYNGWGSTFDRLQSYLASQQS